MKHNSNNTMVAVRTILSFLALITAFSGCALTVGRTPGDLGTSESTVAAIPQPLDSQRVRTAYLAAGVEISRCLRHAGFAAYSVDFGPIDLTAASDNLMVDNDATKRRIGYGVSAIYTEYVALAKLVGTDGPNPIPRSQESSAAYQQANGRCTGAIMAKYPVLQQAIESSRTSVAFGDLWPKVEADERMVPLRKVWRTCMREAGYKAENPWAAAEDFKTDAEPLYGVSLADIDNGDVLDAAGGSPTDRELIAKRDALRAKELRMARADAVCSESIAQQRDAIWGDQISRAGNTPVDAQPDDEETVDTEVQLLGKYIPRSTRTNTGASVSPKHEVS